MDYLISIFYKRVVEFQLNSLLMANNMVKPMGNYFIITLSKLKISNKIWNVEISDKFIL